jgi:hypothetical protein
VCLAVAIIVAKKKKMLKMVQQAGDGDVPQTLVHNKYRERNAAKQAKEVATSPWGLILDTLGTAYAQEGEEEPRMRAQE